MSSFIWRQAAPLFALRPVPAFEVVQPPGLPFLLAGAFLIAHFLYFFHWDSGLGPVNRFHQQDTLSVCVFVFRPKAAQCASRR
jgi:hypothetical protein